MAGETGAGGELKTIEYELERGYYESDEFRHKNRWSIAEQSEGCQAEVIYLAYDCQTNSARWLLRVRADQCDEGDLILTCCRKPEWIDLQAQSQYHLYAVRDNAIFEADEATLGRWKLQEPGGMIHCNDYRIFPGQWGYLRALSEKWSPYIHIMEAYRTAGVDSYYRAWPIPVSTFTHLIDPLIKAKQKADNLDQILTRVTELITNLLARDIGSPLEALVRSKDRPTSFCAGVIVNNLILLAQAAGIPLPDKNLTARTKK